MLRRSCRHGFGGMGGDDGGTAQEFDKEDRQSGQDCRPDGDGRRRVLPEDEHQHGDADDGGFQDPAVAGQPVLPRPGAARRPPFRSRSRRPVPDLAGQDSAGREWPVRKAATAISKPTTKTNRTAVRSGTRRVSTRLSAAAGETVADGMVLRKMFSPMASARARTAMATAIPNPTRLVVRRLQPRGATAMAPMALSTVIQARMGAVRSSVLMASVALASSGDCKQRDLCVDFRNPGRDVHSLLDKQGLDPGDDFLRGDRDCAALVDADGAARVSGSQVDDSLVRHPVDLGPEILELRAGDESGHGGMDQRLGLLSNGGRQPGDHGGDAGCDFARVRSSRPG